MTRRIAFLSALVLMGMIFAALLLLWATQWRVPQADCRNFEYELAAYWDGADIATGKLERPIGIGVAPAGDVYISDAKKRIVHLSPHGEFLGEWGSEGNGPGQFSNPIGIAVASDGSVFVSDYDLDRIQKFTGEGKLLLQFGGSGSDPGQFDAAAGLAVDPQGFIYVADFYNHRVQKFRPDGSFQQIIGHSGRVGDGALHYPTGLAVTLSENLIAADAYNYRLQWFDGDGNPLRRVGYHLFWLWPRPASSTGGFHVPSAVAAGPNGLIHVADSGNHRVVMLSEEGEYISQWAIPNPNPNVFSPEQVAVSPDGMTVYATDLAANRVLVLVVTRTTIN